MGTVNNQEKPKGQHGGKRPGAGRPVGGVQRATPSQRRSLAELAREHTDVALRALVDVATNGTTESGRVAAANALLDRGYGKPMQSVAHENADGSNLTMPVLHVTLVGESDA